MKSRFANYNKAKTYLSKKNDDRKFLGMGYRDLADYILKSEGWSVPCINRKVIDQIILRFILAHKNSICEPKAQAPRKKRKENPVSRDGFYQSWQWKKLRYRVLKEYGPVCMCCGTSRDDGVRIVVDHIKPVSKYPELALDFNNLQVLCDDCNMGKSNIDMTDYRPELEYPECDVSLSVLMGERIH